MSLCECRRACDPVFYDTKFLHCFRACAAANGGGALRTRICRCVHLYIRNYKCFPKIHVHTHSPGPKSSDSWRRGGGTASEFVMPPSVNAHGTCVNGHVWSLSKVFQKKRGYEKRRGSGVQTTVAAPSAARENVNNVHRCNATMNMSLPCSPGLCAYVHAAGVALTELVEELANLPADKGLQETAPTFTKDYAQALQVV